MNTEREKAMRKKISETYVVHCGTDISFLGTKKQCEKFKEKVPYLNSYVIHSLEDYGDACYSDGDDNGYQMGYDMAQD